MLFRLWKGSPLDSMGPKGRGQLTRGCVIGRGLRWLRGGEGPVTFLLHWSTLENYKSRNLLSCYRILKCFLRLDNVSHTHSVSALLALFLLVHEGQGLPAVPGALVLHLESLALHQDPPFCRQPPITQSQQLRLVDGAQQDHRFWTERKSITAKMTAALKQMMCNTHTKNMSMKQLYL